MLSLGYVTHSFFFFFFNLLPLILETASLLCFHPKFPTTRLDAQPAMSTQHEIVGFMPLPHSTRSDFAISVKDTAILLIIRLRMLTLITPSLCLSSPKFSYNSSQNFP